MFGPVRTDTRDTTGRRRGRAHAQHGTGAPCETVKRTGSHDPHNSSIIDGLAAHDNGPGCANRCSADTPRVSAAKRAAAVRQKHDSAAPFPPEPALDKQCP